MIYFVGFIALVATVASLTRLATTDEIAAPWRVKVRAKYGPNGFVPRMLECDRCTAVHAAWIPTLAAVALTGIGQPWWVWPILAVLWIPVSLGVAYLSYLLIYRGEK